MISTRRSLNFTAPLVLEPPSHCALFPIALVPGRHLIGSSDDCDIRLNFAGIASRHAIVMVGESRTIVKSMDSRSWVNDSPLTEMALRAGDRLSIGPVTFRIRSAMKEEIAAFEPMASGAGTQVHRIDLPAEVVADQAQKPVTEPVTLPEDARISKTDEVLAVIEVPPLSAHLIDDRGSQSDENSKEKLTDLQPVTANSLDDRLGEIQQRLAELEFNQTSVSHVNAPVSADANSWAQSLQAREVELLRRVEQIAVSTEHHQEWSARLAKQESHLDARQQQLVIEAKRIEEIAASTRSSLSEEHAQHLAIWNEWDVAYQRMASEIASQTEAINQQRQSLQVEADRLSLIRTELQRSRVVHEQNRKEFGTDQTNLANERAEVLALKSRFEDQRHQHQLEVAEQRRQIDAARREIDLKRSDIDTSIQQLEHERQLVMTDRSEQIKRVEQDNQRQASQYSALTADHERFRVEREQFASLRTEFEQKQIAFQRECSGLETARAEATAVLQERDALLDRCRQLELSLADRNAIGVVAEIDGQSPPCEDRTQVEALPSEIAQQSLFAQELPDQVVRHIAIDHSEAGVIDPSNNSANPWSADPTLSVETREQAVPETTVLSPVPLVASWHEEIATNSDRLEAENTVGAELAKIGEDPVTMVTDPSPVEVERSGSNPDSITLAENQNIWGDLTIFGLGSETPTPPPLPVDFSPPPTGIDPWGSFVPTVSTPPEVPVIRTGQQSAGQVAIQSMHQTATTEANDGVAPQPTYFAESLEQELNAGETMDVVNREFGTPVEEIAEAPIAGGLPSWWVESKPSQASVVDEAFKVDQPNWVTEALKADPTESVPKPVAVSDTGDDLRSKLAMLFDLPTADESEPSPESIQDAGNQVMGDASPVAGEELAAMVDDLVVKDEEPASESAQDSVEEFMARLLARSRGDDARPPVANKPTQPVTPVEDGASFSLPADPDRSHLMAEPKHKQDKQAVRENLQSFRKVAHLSARSALARHSLQQLRNATIAKGILLGASTIAMTWFFARPLFGSEFQMWKAGACGLASLLSGVEFHRSWSQLFKPSATPAPANAAGAGNGMEPISDAAIEVTVDVPVSIEELKVEPAQEA